MYKTVHNISQLVEFTLCIFKMGSFTVNSRYFIFGTWICTGRDFAISYFENVKSPDDDFDFFFYENRFKLLEIPAKKGNSYP